MPDIGTMHQLNPEPLHIGTMHQLGPELLHAGEIITPQAQAEEYAREAQESADNAALSAAAAQSAAETAQQAAQSIAPALDEKADAIHTAAGPAPIVSIPDAAAAPVDALTVGIEPVQDLHGYDNPWPAGGGANLLDLDKASYNTNAYGLTVTRDGDVVRITGTATQTGNLSFNLIIDYSGETLGGKGYVLQVFDVTSGYTVGAVWGFRRESEKAFAISLINITAGQNVNCTMKLSVAATSQTSWTPYSNICPITGWTGAKVTRTGKNLIENSGSSRENRSVTYTVNQDGSVSLTGTASGGTSWWRGQVPIAERIYIKAGTYRLSGGISNNIMVYLVGQYIDGTGIMNTTVGGGVYDKGNGLTFTLYQDAYINYQMQVNNGTSTGVTVYPIISDSATSYEPYSGDTYPITFPVEAGTVYGGSLNVTTGVLTVNRAQIASYNGETLPGEWISDRDVYAPGTTPTTGAQVVYELSTPITYNLTPQEIRTLLGANNIWADTGDVTVGYKADTKLYIDKKFAELQALILEH